MMWFLHCINLYPPKNLNLINLLNINKIKKLLDLIQDFQITQQILM